MDATGGRDIRWLATAATERDLPQALASRFGALVFRCPPLAERQEDLPLLFAAMLQAAARREGRPEPRVDRGIERELAGRAWKGQLRELQACAQDALRLVEGAVLRRLPAQAGPPPLEIPWPPEGELEEMMRTAGRSAAPALLQRALEKAGGDLGAAAAALGLTVRTLASRLREHGISLENRDP